MSWHPRVTVAAVIEREGQFLMVEERDSRGKRVINQPAGHLEESERLVDAVRRETLEETGWQFEPTAFVGVYQWQIPPNGDTYIRFCFSGDILDQLPQQPLDADILRTIWISKNELQSNTHHLRSPLVLSCIEDYELGNLSPLDLIHDL